MNLSLLFTFLFNVTGATGTDFYGHALKDIDGKPLDLSAYKGKVVLVVNTASKCGYTPQYEALQALHLKYSGQGFVVLGVPANNFMGQEPGNEKEIKEFCSLNYKVTFPMSAKVSVRGSDMHPLFSFLTTQENPDFKGDIRWNFEKFLISKDGKLLRRFRSGTKPMEKDIVEAVEAALK